MKSEHLNQFPFLSSNPQAKSTHTSFATLWASTPKKVERGFTGENTRSTIIYIYMNTHANSLVPTTIFESKASTTLFFFSTNSSRNTCSTHVLIFIVISVIFIIILFMIITIIILRPIHGLIGLGSGHNWSWGGDVILCTHMNTQIHKCSWGQLLLGWGHQHEHTH